MFHIYEFRVKFCVRTHHPFDGFGFFMSGANVFDSPSFALDCDLKSMALWGVFHKRFRLIRRRDCLHNCSTPSGDDEGAQQGAGAIHSGFILGVTEHPKFDGLTSEWAAIQIRS